MAANTAPSKQQLVLRSSILRASAVESGTPRRIYNFLAPSFMDVIETAPEDRSKNDSDALTPAPASLVTSNLLMQDPDVFSTASSSEPDPQMEEALSYRASLLFNVRDDPRFLRFLPVVFPPPPSFEHGLRGGESTLGSSFYMLATLYPAYLERDIWYHIGFDVEGVLPFVPYITGDNYNPHDLSRRLSSDIPDVGGYARYTGISTQLAPLYRIFLNDDFFPHHEPRGTDDSPGPSTGADDSLAEDGGPFPLQSHLSNPMLQWSGRFKNYVEAWEIYSIEFRSKDELYEVELVLPKVIVQSICLAFVLGACSFLILRALGVPPLRCLFGAVPLSMALFFAGEWKF